MLPVHPGFRTVEQFSGQGVLPPASDIQAALYVRGNQAEDEAGCQNGNRLVKHIDQEIGREL